MENTWNKSMRFATLTLLGTTLALVPAATGLRAQTNPDTSLKSAKTAAQTAQAAGQSSSGQTPNQPKPQQSPSKSAQYSATPKQSSNNSTTAKNTQASSTKPTTTRPNSTYLPSAKAKTSANTSNSSQNNPKTVPVAARPTAPAPAPQPVIVPKPHSTEPMMKVATEANRRDPFSTLIGREPHGGTPSNPVLPPGKAGLQVESLIIQGLVRGPNGMIAVVENPQQRVYFLHEGDSLFDGKVDRITIEGITFHETGKDAFGKPLVRDVTKHLNVTSSGEQL